MSYPPEGCIYELVYRLGRRGQGTERFDDEYRLGKWCLEMEATGAWDSAVFSEGPEEFEGANGVQIFCVSPDGERVGIGYRHPRLVMGRIDSRKHIKE